MKSNRVILEQLQSRFSDATFTEQTTKDEILTLWIPLGQVQKILRYLKYEIFSPFTFLYDLTAVDERTRNRSTNHVPQADFTLVYHLFSYTGNCFIRIKVGLFGEYPSAPSITSLWANANWYEREVFDLFGIKFEGHPHLARILMPRTWEGHPLRKEHPARATEMGPFRLWDEKEDREQEALLFKPEEWGLERQSEDSDFMFMNIGPQHPGTHGVLRIILQLDGEDIVDAVPEIGFHHRGAEKMGERQSWHTYIPYTDRVDYLGGVMNNLAYLLAVEKLAGIEVPERVKVIRVMMCEFFRIASHLVWYGTFAQDLGQLSPVFYMFSDREKVFQVVEAVCGGRMHPNWFRIGGLSQDLPKGWETLVQSFLDYFPKRLKEYDAMVLKNSLFKARTKGIGIFTLEEAIEWGVTGANLRACGSDWDFRKKRPYSGYEFFDFDIPTGQNGDCYDRALVRVEEMRQSLRIIEQCLKHMPEGPYKADHPLTTPPLKKHTMQDIETLITHFLNVSWGPVIPAGEAMSCIEATKGANSYYLISDGNTSPYRARIRTPSFPHMQMLPYITRGYTVADLLSILGAMDYVLADIDR
ncbi:NADH-quinone oxidoreductase subunit C/D [Adhaeribacter aerolatus]|uniref:NADH-quinone oxidoreductase subunit C/D n=1 Tax=Adhaeribacter aerolatus TaxID=670289 RepID=A0A512AZP0_9BACT|nr:NADH-quinone oxidoreductase subunit C/D [Adhaeribacter aerolatus]GEO05181.1 NADH-quinone oxidoreductase subunit C/D [Adhaeribacter aerolatus]